MSADTIPITVVAGYRGAGKTTLLNHLLRSATGRRIVLVCDDFGPIELEPDPAQGGEHGCICCNLGAELASTLLRLRHGSESPVHILIEASGVADPRMVAQCGHLPGFRLDGTIVVVDAERIRRSARDRRGGKQIRQQLRAADILVLNKVDLVPAGERTAAVQWLQEMAPGTQVVEASQARLPALLLFGSHSADDARLERR